MTEPNPDRPSISLSYEYLDLAEQFYNAFHELRERPSYQSSPRHLLLSHSIELALKAYLALCGASLKQLKDDFGHKLDKLVNKAVEKGLPLSIAAQEEIKHLKEPHLELRHRYPAEKTKPVYIIEQCIPAARELFTAVSNTVRGARLATDD